MSRNVLFVKTSSLGDVVHNMPAVTEISRKLGLVNIDWVVEEAYAPLVRLHSCVNRVIPMAYRRWRGNLASRATWSEIRAFRAALEAADYDAVIDAQGLLKSALIALWAKGRRYGFDWSSVREPLASLFYNESFPISFSLHAVQRCRMLAARVGEYALDAPLDYGLSLGHRPAAALPYVVLLHATARKEKEWLKESWIELGRILAGRGFRVVLPHGSDAELERSLQLAEMIPSAEVPDRAPLDRVALMLAGASVVVGVDTGLLHLATAIRVPAVGIFVGSDPELNGPVGAGPIATCGHQGRSVRVAEVVHAVEEVTEVRSGRLNVAR